MSHTLSDIANRVNQALRCKKVVVPLPNTKTARHFGKLLLQENLILKYEVVDFSLSSKNSLLSGVKPLPTHNILRTSHTEQDALLVKSQASSQEEVLGTRKALCLVRHKPQYRNHKTPISLYTAGPQRHSPVSPRQVSCSFNRNNGKRKACRYCLFYLKSDPSFSRVKTVSTPGLRVFKTVQELSTTGAVKTAALSSDASMLILSTSHGFLTDRQARDRSLGGEVVYTLS